MSAQVLQHITINVNGVMIYPPFLQKLCVYVLAFIKFILFDFGYILKDCA